MKRQTLFGVKVEALHLDLGHDVGVRPGDVRQGPVSGRTRPNSSALESRSYLYDVPLPDPKLDLASVAHHLQDVAVSRLVTGLSH